MSTHHANPGEVVDLKTWADDQPDDRTKAIVKTDEMELIRIYIQSGKTIPNHKVNGPITVHCIEGKVEFTAMGSIKELWPGQLLHLMPGEPHSLFGADNSVILLTVIFKK